MRRGYKRGRGTSGTKRSGGGVELYSSFMHPLRFVSLHSSPCLGDSAGTITSLFALTMAEEFRRVLRKDGLYFQILAAEDHLMGLKSIIYPELFHKEKQTVPEIPGFQRIQSTPIRFSFTVEGQQIQNLLSMTPHVYRISKEGAQRLENTHVLTDTASCVLNVYRPEP